MIIAVMALLALKMHSGVWVVGRRDGPTLEAVRGVGAAAVGEADGAVEEDAALAAHAERDDGMQPTAKERGGAAPDGVDLAGLQAALGGGLLLADVGDRGEVVGDPAPGMSKGAGPWGGLWTKRTTPAAALVRGTAAPASRCR